ncbi:MAG: hypothetical protein ABSG68_24275 [Thermoguttaceae bacterium]
MSVVETDEIQVCESTAPGPPRPPHVALERDHWQGRICVLRIDNGWEVYHGRSLHGAAVAFEPGTVAGIGEHIGQARLRAEIARAAARAAAGKLHEPHETHERLV